MVMSPTVVWKLVSSLCIQHMHLISIREGNDDDFTHSGVEGAQQPVHTAHVPHRLSAKPAFDCQLAKHYDANQSKSLLHDVQQGLQCLQAYTM